MLKILFTLMLIPVLSLPLLAQEDDDYPIIFRSGLVTNPFEGAATFQLLRLNPETGDIQPFEALEGMDVTWAAWSPDGTKILFTDDRTRSAGYFSEGDLYVMNADGSNLQKFTETPHLINRVEWLANSEEIAYGVGTEPGMISELVIVSASTGEVVSRTPSRGFILSPDNRFIAFLQQKPDVEYFFDLYVSTLQGEDVRQIPTGVGHVPIIQWSQDGSQLTFVYYELVNNQPVSDIYTVAPSGDGSVVNLTRTGTARGPLSYSPDGSQIAYFNGMGDLYLMNADGSDQRLLSENTGEGIREAAPKWSPDGLKIAFEIPSTQSTMPYTLYTLHVYDLQTDTVTDLSPNLDPEGSYSWSPDSTEIVFMGKTESSAEIYVVLADGSEAPRDLTRSPDMFDLQPLWQP
jgi:Tol biopolymer transport system component